MKTLLLAAGLGTRLGKLSEKLPKCLMPIGDFPLLSYWIDSILNIKCPLIIINTHYQANLVSNFIGSLHLGSLVKISYENHLLGTAGTIRNNANEYQLEPLLVIHADNWCPCDLGDFVKSHNVSLQKNCLITMMTFNCDNPELCGIVEVNSSGIVHKIYEKTKNAKSTLANGAIYILDPFVVQWIVDRPEITDFSTEVLPHFLGRISTWHNSNVLRDIGSPEALIKAQFDPKPIIKHQIPDWLLNLHHEVKGQLLP
ncbi:nucleotidyltransferase family protein [Polynucleobacter sp. IMCC30063]|uniref:nucleotidyltransferase family protein n=1 Tax=Polynucleobacter sp. IMCC30063 TaxID=2907298 RepID=UPI001F2476F4|nr:nucleotidyltransferase family protein [Polynucleobacter sp. IMCC30063]MCE7505302.1 nucleotidyltransferase family protein [Polynucleobacter sp. IMCC30063]